MKACLKAVLLGAALTVGGLALLPLSQTALATTLQLNLSNSVPHNAETDRAIEKVYHKGRRHRRAKRHRRYDRHRHGGRYRHRRGRYKHYYGGYWYGVPWWLGSPSFGTPYYDPYYDVVPVPRRSRHVDWCHRKYRSYNARTDTFRGYDGYDHHCRSPYRR